MPRRCPRLRSAVVVTAARVAAIALCAGALPPQTETPMRGVLDSPGGDLPFVLTDLGGPYAIHNGSERIRVFPKPDGDGFRVPLPPYDSELLLHRDGDDGRYAGLWTKRGPAGVVSMRVRWEPIAAEARVPGTDAAPRFRLAGEPIDLRGRWRVKFSSSEDPAVAIVGDDDGGAVRRVPGEVTATFLTTTGDYRWLAGTAKGRSLRLSCFDGAHAFLFAAELQDDGTLRGDFWSGAAWHETWTAVRDAHAALPDAFALTKAVPGVRLADLRYPDAEGREHRVGDLLGTAAIVVLFGTWCPNCGDAGPVLQDLLARHREAGLRVLGLAFEHGADRTRHARVVADYQKTRGVDWPILIAGPSDKDAASAAFPVVDRVRAYPTLLFVDAGGAVQSVYQGFCGPATGDAFAQQRRRLDAVVERLLGDARR